MLHIKSLDEGLELFKALGSDVRVEIIKILSEESSMNMNELAGRLGISNGALTAHIRKLEECGIVDVTTEVLGHGNQKVCSVNLDKILIDIKPPVSKGNIYNTDIKVGHFSDYEVYPTCGLASQEKIIGEVDDVRYFSHHDRFDADILWFTKGYVEYSIPNFVPSGRDIKELCISAELSSEAPGVNSDWPSDIFFYINNIQVGTWVSPGDFGDVKGILTPEWWYPDFNQYGLLKMLTVNNSGTYIDGVRISDVTISDLELSKSSHIRFRLEVPENAEHVGGLTIFGKGFGNYNQDINVKMSY